MSISFVGAQGAAAATVTIPTHQSGDMILIFAYRDGSNTAPTAPTAGGTVPTWTLIGTSGANTNSSRFHYAVATASTTTSGTWTNATELICLVYRGTKLVGANAGGSGSATTTVNYPALTLQRTDNSSWVVGVAGHRTATNVELAPSGMTNRASSGTEAAGHDTNGTVTSWASTNVTVNASSAFRSWTVELRDATVVLTAEAGSYSETGVAVNLPKGRTVIASAASFSLSGKDAAVNHNAIIVASVGSTSFVGKDATVLHAAKVVASVGVFTFNGNNADLHYVAGTDINVDPGNFTVAGNIAGLYKGYILTASPRAFYVTGNTSSSVYTPLPGGVKKFYYQVHEADPRKLIVTDQLINDQLVYYINPYLRIL